MRDRICLGGSQRRGHITRRGFGIKTRDDLADLAVDELSEISQLDEEKAKKLIMAARAHWFEDKQAGNEAEKPAKKQEAA